MSIKIGGRINGYLKFEGKKIPFDFELRDGLFMLKEIEETKNSLSSYNINYDLNLQYGIPSSQFSATANLFGVIKSQNSDKNQEN